MRVYVIRLRYISVRDCLLGFADHLDWKNIRKQAANYKKEDNCFLFFFVICAMEWSILGMVEGGGGKWAIVPLTISGKWAKGCIQQYHGK